MRVRMRYMLAALLGLAVVFPAMARLAEYRNPEMVAAVEAGEIDEANVLWWGFDEEDSAAYLQAAINSGVARQCPMSDRIGSYALSFFAAIRDRL